MTYTYTEARNIADKLAKELGYAPEHMCVIGSALISKTGNDVDILCYAVDEGDLHEAGFAPDLADRYEGRFLSCRRGDVNVLLTHDLCYFLTEIAVALGAYAANKFDLNLDSREGRITFHRLVRENVAAYLSYYENKDFPCET